MINEEWPDFLIGGVPRAATTSLASSLSEHSNIFIPKVKEVEYFHWDHNWGKGDTWYKSHFPESRNLLVCDEATPYYLCSPKACFRIKEKIPEIKLIFLLRILLIVHFHIIAIINWMEEKTDHWRRL